MRHLYDLHVIRAHYDAADVAALAREIMPHDADVFGQSVPGLSHEPPGGNAAGCRGAGNETPAMPGATQTFRRDMVYGDTVEYAACMGTLSALAQLLQHA